RAVTLVFDRDRGRAIDRLGAFCELARREGLAPALEFTPLTGGCDDLDSAVAFVDAIGREALGLGVDVLHLVRSGGGAEALRALAPDCFRYAQLCDGHGLHVSTDYFGEAHQREIPGRGDFPLAEIVAALPAGITLEVEVPSDRR